MLPAHKRKSLIFFIITLAAMLLLETGISNMVLSRSTSFSWNPPVIEALPDIEMRSTGQSNLLLILFVVAMLSIFLSRDGRKKLLFLILGIAIVTYILYRFKPQGLPEEFLQGAMPTQVLATEEAKITPVYPAPPAEVFDPHTPSWLITAVGVSIALILTAALVALLGMAFSYRLKGSLSFTDAFSEEIEAALEALEAGLDLKDAISRCYAQMSRVLQEERGLMRDQAMTPREFELVLTHKGFPPGPVQALTRLFEQVRYGRLAPDEDHIQVALSSLNAILEHCQALKTAEI